MTEYWYVERADASLDFSYWNGQEFQDDRIAAKKYLTKVEAEQIVHRLKKVHALDCDFYLEHVLCLEDK